MEHLNQSQQLSNPVIAVKVGYIIDTLKKLDGDWPVDGETMQYILEQVGLDGQILTQMVMQSENRDAIEEMLDESDEQWRLEFNRKQQQAMINNDPNFLEKCAKLFGGKK